MFLLLEMYARDLDHLRGKGASFLRTCGCFDPPEKVCDLVMLHPHQREKSILCAEVGFEGSEEQIVFKRRMGFQCKGKCSDLILQNGNRMERWQGLLDISKKQVKYAVFAEERVCDQHGTRYALCIPI